MFEIVIASLQDWTFPVTPFYSVLVSIWSVTMLKFWKRKELTFAMQCGTTKFEEEELDRAEYKVRRGGG